MRLITSFELSNKHENELSALFSGISRMLVMTEEGTPERRNALASLENINRARGPRAFAP